MNFMVMIMTVPRIAPQPLKPGYFLGQEASSLPKNVPFRNTNPYFKAFTTEDNAKAFFEQIAGKVDGLDYVNYWYEQADGEMARKIAEIGRSYQVDMWAGIRWQKQFRDIPVIPAPYTAWTMDSDGHIIPALWEDRNHSLDCLNPQAVDWMLAVLEERYWPHVKGAVNGFFFPENRITTAHVPRNRESFKPWTLHAYSPFVLEQWKRYCLDKEINWEGRPLQAFPVPKPHMTLPHPDKTAYIPDDRPQQVPSFTRFIRIPRGTDIWLAWEDFLCALYHESYLHRVAASVNRLNADVRDWRGVCFFNNDTTTLDYRNFRSDQARTGILTGNWPQGRRMGVDIRRLFKDPEITCFITETVQNAADYMPYEENFLSHGMALARKYGREKDYGFMVHYAPAWGGIGDFNTIGGAIMDDLEEETRWAMIHKYKPPVFSFYSIPLVLTREGAWYHQDAADRFWFRVAEYKKMLL